MKFDVLEIVDGNAMEDGVWLHLLNPADGEPLYRDPEAKTKPCRALVRSDQSGVHRDSMFRENTKLQGRMQRAKKDEREKVTREVTEATMALRFANSLVSLENCTSAGGVVRVEREDAVQMANDPPMQWLVGQVLQFSGDVANYVKEDARPTKGAAAAPARSKTSSNS